MNMVTSHATSRGWNVTTEPCLYCGHKHIFPARQLRPGRPSGRTERGPRAYEFKQLTPKRRRVLQLIADYPMMPLELIAEMAKTAPSYVSVTLHCCRGQHYLRRLLST